MRVKIVSDGTPRGTRVLVIDDQGAEHPLTGVRSVAWSMEVGGEATAQLGMVGVECDVASVLDPALDPARAAFEPGQVDDPEAYAAALASGAVRELP